MMPTVASIVSGSFAFVRAHIPLVLIWSVVYAVGAILMSVVAQPLYQAQLAAAAAAEPQLPPGFFVRFLLIYVVLLAMLVALFAAIFRAVLQPEESRAAYLRFGPGELRLFGLVVLLAVAGFVGILLSSLIFGIVIGIVIALMGGQGTLFWLALLYLAIFGVISWFWVRLSPAGPLTILRGRFVIGEAWRLTRGRFWTLFGGYLLVMLAVFIVFAIFCAIAMGGYFAAVARSVNDPAAVEALAVEQMKLVAIGSPRWLLMLISGSLLGGAAIALQGAMTAIATRDLLADADAG